MQEVYKLLLGSTIINAIAMLFLLYLEVFARLSLPAAVVEARERVLFCCG